MNERRRESNALARYAVLGQVGMEMVAPIVGGLWVDYAFDFLPWFTVAGAVLGFTAGMVHLIRFVKRDEKSQDGPTGTGKRRTENEERRT